MKNRFKLKIIICVVVAVLLSSAFIVSAKTVSSSSSSKVSSDVSDFLAQNNRVEATNNSSSSSKSSSSSSSTSSVSGTAKTIANADSEKGSITPSGEVMIKTGSSVTFKASANSGYVFSHFLVDGQKVEATNDYSYAIKGDGAEHSIEAIFNETKMVQLHFINLGESTAVLVEDDGEFALIDTGRSTDSVQDENLESGDEKDKGHGDNAGKTSDIAGHQDELLGYLKNKGVTKLKFMILTNSQPEYMGGASYVLQNFPVETVYMKPYNKNYVVEGNENDLNYQSYNKTLEAIAGKTDVEIKWGDDLGDINVEGLLLKNARFYFMNYQDKEASNPGVRVDNEGMRSMMVLVSYNSRTALITGGYKNNPNYSDETNRSCGNVHQIYAFLEDWLSKTSVDSDHKPDIYVLPSHGDNDDNDIGDYLLSNLNPQDIVQFGYFCRLSADRLSDVSKTSARMFLMQNTNEDLSVKLSTSSSDPISNDSYIYYSPANSSWYAYSTKTSEETKSTSKELVKNDFLDFYFKKESVKYYFDKDGKAVKMSFFTKDDNIYYSGYYGVLYKGVHKIDKDEYYFDNTTCAVYTGQFTIEGSETKQYCATAKGALRKGWLKINDNAYYYDEKEATQDSEGGCLKFGWIAKGDKWYYADKEKGILFSGEQTIDTGTYLFDKNTNFMLTGFQTIQGKKYYFEEQKGSEEGMKLKARDIIVRNDTYHLGDEGEVQKGWLDTDGKGFRYFSQDTGQLKTGWIKLSNNWYYTDPNNGGIRLQSGKAQVENDYYYFDPSDEGKMKLGWIQIEGKYYYFDSTGKMKTGWLTLGDKTYNLDDYGAMRTSWQIIDGSYRYFDPTTGEMATGIQTIDGQTYKFSDAGVMQTGWDGSSYYDTNGQLRTGWFNIGSSTYYADPTTGSRLSGLHLVDNVACLFDNNGVLLKKSKDAQTYLNTDIKAILG